MGFMRVIRPGMLTTVQDLGRRGWSSIGVPEGGAADTRSLRTGNRLVGNPDGAAALEMTLTGGEFAFEDGATIAVVGGTVGVTIERERAGGGVVVANTSTPVRAGERVRIGPITRGARAYLCIAGGVRVRSVLGSASTHLGAGFGGMEGRGLRVNDRVEFGDEQPIRIGILRDLELAEFAGEPIARRVLRAVAGAHAREFDSLASAAFWDSEFNVSQQSDRVGVRLQGPAIRSRGEGRMPSAGMPWGAVEITPAGEPIVLGPDHPTTGGYPVIACVATVDLPVLGQLRPGDTVRFERISQMEGLRLFRESERRFDEVLPKA